MCATTATLGYCVMLVIDVIHKTLYLSRIAASFPHLNALVVPSSTIETSFQGRSIKVKFQAPLGPISRGVQFHQQ